MANNNVCMYCGADLEDGQHGQPLFQKTKKKAEWKLAGYACDDCYYSKIDEIVTKYPIPGDHPVRKVK